MRGNCSAIFLLSHSPISTDQAGDALLSGDSSRISSVKHHNLTFRNGTQADNAGSKGQSQTRQTQTLLSALDFDGEYGRQYRQSSQNSIPGHDVLHEIAIAAVNTTSAHASRILVVGPGPGDELIPLLNSCPDADITVIEPSAQMLDLCARSVADHADAKRCRFLRSTLADALHSGLQPNRFDLVVCHNVVHLVAPAEQTVMLQQLRDLTATGGSLLVSSYSEAEAPATVTTILNVARQRLISRGVSLDRIDQLLASRNSVVFSLDARRLTNVLSQQGWSEPVQLYQGLFARLWLCRAPT